MFCPNCGIKINDNSKFCKECGTPIEEESNIDLTQIQETNAQPESNLIVKKSKKKIIIALIAAVVLLMSAIIVFIVLFGNNNEKRDISSTKVDVKEYLTFYDCSLQEAINTFKNIDIDGDLPRTYRGHFGDGDKSANPQDGVHFLYYQTPGTEITDYSKVKINEIWIENKEVMADILEQAINIELDNYIVDINGASYEVFACDDFMTSYGIYEGELPAEDLAGSQSTNNNNSLETTIKNYLCDPNNVKFSNDDYFQTKIVTEDFWNNNGHYYLTISKGIELYNNSYDTSYNSDGSTIRSGLIELYIYPDGYDNWYRIHWGWRLADGYDWNNPVIEYNIATVYKIWDDGSFPFNLPDDIMNDFITDLNTIYSTRSTQ